MKKRILTVLGAVPLILFAQEDFTLKGKVDDLQDGAKIFFQYNDQGQRVLDSATVSKGAFQYQGSVSEPTQGALILAANGQSMDELQVAGERPPMNMVYLSKGVIKFEGKDFNEAKASGNAINDDYSKYREQLEEVNEAFNALNVEFSEAPDEKKQDEEFVQGLQAKAEEIYERQQALNEDFVKDNPKSYISLAILDELVSPENVTKLKPTYEALAGNLKTTELGKSLATKMADIEKLAIGAVAPDFTAPDTTGNDFTLSSLRGKYVLLDFWASWCGPCRQENPNVVAAYNKFKDKNFTVLGVSLDRPGKKEDWINAIHADQLEQWPHVSDLQFWDSPVAKLYAIRSIPQNFLIDPEGKIVAVNVRGEALEEKLAEILN